MENVLWNIVKFFIFPGLLFTVIFAFFVQWVDRKFFASAQQRIGPPVTQPIWDFIKLLAKRDQPPEQAPKEFSLLPSLLVVLSFIIAAFIPVYGAFSANISFQGDIFFIIFLITIHAAIVFLIGWSSRSPYGLAGGTRVILMELSIELPFAFLILVPALITGSAQLSVISSKFWPSLFQKPLYLVIVVPAFILIVLIGTAILEKAPFDAGHAETELVHGWQTELKGKSYALVQLSADTLTWSIAGLIAILYLRVVEFSFPGFLFFLLGKNLDVIGILCNFGLFVILTLIVVVIFSFIRTTQARLRVDQVMNYFWRIFFPGSFLILTGIIFIGGA